MWEGRKNRHKAKDVKCLGRPMVSIHIHISSYVRHSSHPTGQIAESSSVESERMKARCYLISPSPFVLQLKSICISYVSAARLMKKKEEEEQ